MTARRGDDEEQSPAGAASSSSIVDAPRCLFIVVSFAAAFSALVTSESKILSVTLVHAVKPCDKSDPRDALLETDLPGKQIAYKIFLKSREQDIKKSSCAQFVTTKKTTTTTQERVASKLPVGFQKALHRS
jgi:hypothetical protein